MPRQTNKQKALDLWQVLWKEYESVNHAIHVAVRAGRCKNGALIAYGRAWNNQLRLLQDLPKPTRTELQVLEKLIRQDITRAQKFVDGLPEFPVHDVQ